MTLFQWNKFVPVFIVTILIFTDGAIGNGSDYTLCTSSICQETGEEIINSIDNTVDPCTDFYQHACGGWIVKHPVSNSDRSFSQFTLIERKVEQQLKVLLENEVADDTGVVRKAKDFYKSCMDLAAIDSKGLQPLLTILTANGDWPLIIPLNQWNPQNLTWQQIHENFAKLTEYSGLFELSIGFEVKNSRRHIITLFSQGMPSGDRDFSSSLMAYKTYALSAALILARSRGFEVSNNDLIADIAALLEFEKELKSASVTNADIDLDIGSIDRIITIKEAQNIWDTAVNNNSQYKINWLDTVKRRFEGIGIEIDENEKFEIVPGVYFERLAVLLSKTPIRTIVNYIHWYAIRRLLKHGNSVMRRLVLQYLSETEGIEEEPERWRTCSSDHIMPHAVSFMFVKKHGSVTTLASVSQMIEQLREAAKQKIDSSSWMDENAKNLSKEKIDAMVNRIGYPGWYNVPGKIEEYYSELTVGPDYFDNVLASNRFEMKKILLRLGKPANVSDAEWMLPAITVNAGYSDSSNSLNFPAALLQMPIYHYEKPAALRFGGLGAVIGHEISHGFDNSGRHRDKDGNLDQIWSNATIDEYNKKVNCFINQYDKYEITKSSFTNETIYVNGVATLDENLGDNAGFSIGFKAFQQYKISHPNETSRIPALQEYSDEKLYFYGVANHFCDAVQPAFLEHTYPAIWYPPDSVRINGGLSNMKEFADAFACPSGSKMNPTHKCVLWD